MKDMGLIFLIGAMKSGTSTIYRHLELHPDICIPPIKEPEYFSKKLGNNDIKPENYLDLYNIKSNHKYIFDGSTGYTKFPTEKGVPERIYKYGLKPKFIYIVRNPFDRIRSHYNFMSKDLSWKEDLTSEHLINVSNYYLQLKQYLKFFSKKDFLILDFDDLEQDYETVVKSIYDFVGISNYVFSSVAIKNNITKPANRLEIKMRAKIDSVLRKFPYSFRKTMKNGISKFFKREVRELTNRERRLIYNSLKTDMTMFNKEFDFDVSKWGFKNH